MLRKSLVAVLVAAGVLAASGASARQPQFELSATAGWTFSDGVSGQSYTVPNVGTFNAIDLPDAFSWGARAGFMMTPTTEIGFLFNQQATTLDVTGFSDRLEVGDINVNNYHGYIAYNYYRPGYRVIPYFLFGMGATNYGSVSYTGIDGDAKKTNGDAQFSTTWALGAKIFPQEKFGIRLEARYTPTYIKSDPAGWWCDPYWGCYTAADAQYSNQFELNGGLILRFGQN